ncbi:hypothetical protein Peur_042133 [Populus x canadensis]
MSDTLRNCNSPAKRSQPSRLQQRKPASLQIIPAVNPFLSSLNTSATAMDLKSQEDPPPPPRSQGTEGEKPVRPWLVVLKKWEHAVALFYCKLAPFKPSFSVNGSRLVVK